MSKKEEKIIYYKDELNDEFAGDSIVARKIDENYFYGDNSFLWRFKHYFWYKIIAHPIAIIFMKCKYHHTFVNKKVIKPYINKAKFQFGNHTNNVMDALIPTFLQFPNHNYVIVNPNNVSMPVLGKITPYLGAVPLPDNMAATKNFMNIIKLRIHDNRTVSIYPEAHIWPYYTDIRPFPDTSFSSPVTGRSLQDMRQKGQTDEPPACLKGKIKKGQNENPVLPLGCADIIQAPRVPSPDFAIGTQRILCGGSYHEEDRQTVVKPISSAVFTKGTAFPLRQK